MIDECLGKKFQRVYCRTVHMFMEGMFGYCHEVVSQHQRHEYWHRHFVGQNIKSKRHKKAGFFCCRCERVWKEGEQGSNFKQKLFYSLYWVTSYRTWMIRPIGIFEKHDALKQTNKIGVIVRINFFFSFFHIESFIKYLKLFYFLSKGLFVDKLNGWKQCWTIFEKFRKENHLRRIHILITLSN